MALGLHPAGSGIRGFSPWFLNSSTRAVPTRLPKLKQKKYFPGPGCGEEAAVADPPSAPTHRSREKFQGGKRWQRSVPYDDARDHPGLGSQTCSRQRQLSRLWVKTGQANSLPLSASLEEVTMLRLGPEASSPS